MGERRTIRGFPSIFKGTKAQWVKQVGNAVSVRTAKALCAEVLA